VTFNTMLARMTHLQALAARITFGTVEVDEGARRITVQVDPEKLK
jgi:hypothetical protein